MIKLNNVLTVILFLFFIHSLFNLERLIYITELFSVIGIVLFFKFVKTKREDKVVKYLIALIVYLTILTIFSIILSNVSSYVFLRTLTFYYSIFIFFVGYYCFPLIGKKLSLMFFITAPLNAFSYERLSLSLPYLSMNNVIKSQLYMWLFLSATLLAHAAFMGVSTPILALMACAFLFFSNFLVREKFFFGRKGVILLILILAFVWFLGKQVFSGFLVYGYSYFGTEVDNNTFWRLMYWYYLINSNLNEFFFTGVGFGTKLFELSDFDLWWLIATEYSRDNELIEYVLGPHNSLVFIFKRAGFIGLLLFSLFIVFLFQRAVKLKSLGLLACLVLLNVNLFFNVVLESPIWSINYWFVTGLAYASLEKKVNG